ncbi:Tudor and KH domain-containing protein [Eufriesea mexicana]|uniref:Tudor and KH domain-containing protein n=2 Tax=Eufriesea mexicana TaxID=516756 RepID=A0A310ST86_9HYME|nr:Tudor and KH domain-containing protein [Eufriesea mexicana]
MQWMAQHFTLPILLGLSLTSISIAVLYILYKKDGEDIKSRKNNIEIAKRFTVECHIPRQFVPAVIGRGGSVIKDVENKTGTQIHFKENNIDCPDHICIIKGSYENVHLAEEMIKSIVQNQPIIETYVMYIPQNTCSRIIGRGGEVIQRIQTTSNAKIIVDRSYNPYDTNAEKMVTIKGTGEQIAAALLQIKERIREEKEVRLKLEASSTSRMPREKLSPQSTTISTSEQVQTIESLSLQVSDGLVKVYVSAMESPSQFCVQVVGPDTTALDKLVYEMTAYYDDEQNHGLHILKNITLGQIVAAKFSYDKQWYRAEVISTPEDGQCEVYFVDYGDHEMVQIDSVLKLRTDFLSLKLQAVECSLANIKSR